MKGTSLFLSDGFTINGVGYALRHSPSYLVLYGRRSWIRPLCFWCYVALVLACLVLGIYKNAPGLLFLGITQVGALAYRFMINKSRKKKTVPNPPGTAPVATLKARIRPARASATSRAKSPSRRSASTSRRSAGRSSEASDSGRPAAPRTPAD